MSEVIVRMEMPAGCANCPMADDDSRFCKAAKEYIPMLGKPPWCPIIGELPEQHGRLVDADAIWERAGQKKGEADPLALAAELCRSPVIIAATERSER